MIIVHTGEDVIKAVNQVLGYIDDDQLEFVHQEITTQCHIIASSHLNNEIIIIMSEERNPIDYMDLINCCDFELDIDELVNDSNHVKNYNKLYDSLSNRYDLLKFKIKTHPP